MIFAPVQIALFLLVLALAVVLVIRIRRPRPTSPPSCAACGYGVPHDEAQVCPECGGRYVVVGLRSSLYDPFAVWSTATTRGGLLVGAVLVLWLGVSIVLYQFGSTQTTIQNTSTVTINPPAVPSLVPAVTSDASWNIQLTLDATGPTTRPPDSMWLTLRVQHGSASNTPLLRINAIARTFEVSTDDVPLSMGPYASPESINAYLSQVSFSPDADLRAALIKHIDLMLSMASGPTDLLSGSVAHFNASALPSRWFTTSGGGGSARTGLSKSAQLAIMISGIVATFLTIALWLVHCRMLLTPDKLRRQRLIEADGVA